MKKVKRSDVALKAGVAESTVTRALNDSPYISKKVKLRIKKIAKELGYIPNKQASYFAKNKTFRLGLVVRSYQRFTPFSRHYFPELLDGVVLQAQELGYSISIVLDTKKDGTEVDLVHFVKSKEVDGLIFSVIPLGDRRLEELTKYDIPFVLINNHQQGMVSVDGDPYPGMKESFRLAIETGHSHIGYIHGDLGYLNGLERLETFRTLCKEFHVTSTIVAGDFSQTMGRSAAQKLLVQKNPPSLIMTANDRMAFGVMDYCIERGISIPKDVSIIGYDNLGPVNEIRPALTTVDNAVSLSGKEAVNLLVDRLEGKRLGSLRQLLPTHLVIRDSVIDNT